MTDKRRSNDLDQWAVDHLAARYQDACELVKRLWKELFTRAIREGFRPKDAPRTRLISGELYEVLATRSTRTDVDQKRAAQLTARIGRAARMVFEERSIFDLLPGWERNLAQLHAAKRRLLERIVRKCLKTSTAKRLTVRRRKSSRNCGTAARRKAA